MGILSLLMRPSFGAKPKSVRVFRITSPGWLEGDGTAASPLAGPTTSDVTFTAKVSGTFYWSASIGTGEQAYSYSIKKNGSVIASGSALQLNGNTSVAVNATIRFETGADMTGGNLQVWIV